MASRKASRAAVKAIPRNALAGIVMGVPPVDPQKGPAPQRAYDVLKGPEVPTQRPGMFRKSHRVGDRTE